MIDYRNEVRKNVRDGNWTFWYIFPRLLLLIVVLAAIGFGLHSAGLIGNAAVGRAVFEQTQSYVHGKNTYIARLRMQYESPGSADNPEALRRLIIEEAETIDEDKLTPSNRNFVARLRGQTGG